MPSRCGASSPRPWGRLLLFLRRKSNQKAAGGAPPVPPASPFGRYSIFDFICAPTNRGWFYPRAYPSSAATYRLPTSPIGRPCCGTSVRCEFAAQLFGAIPLAGSVPLRGRQAELVDRQSPRSEPRRIHSFTGHRSSSFGSVSVNPPPRQAVPLGRPRVRESRTVGSGALLVTFPAWEK